MLILAAYALMGLALLSVWGAKPERRSLAATLWAIVLSSFTPVHKAPTAVAITNLVVIIVVLTVGCFTQVGSDTNRLTRGTRQPWPYRVLSFYLVWDVLQHFRGTTTNVQGTTVLKNLILFLLAVAASRAVALGWGRTLLSWLATLCLPMAALAAFEQVDDSLKIWPYNEGTDLITNRAQTVLTFLTGRSQATFAHPTAFGIVAAFCTLCAVLCVLDRGGGRPRYLLSMLAGFAAVGMAGTRSALLGLVVAMGVVLYSRFNRYGRIAFVALAGYALYAANVIQIVLGFFSPTSLSVTHRSGIWADIIPHLTSVSYTELFIGQGYSQDKFDALFTSGEFNNGDQFHVFDNQVAFTLVLSGVVGFVLLARLMWNTWRDGDQGVRAMLVIIIVGMLSFDVTTWQSCIALLMLPIGYACGWSHGEQSPPDENSATGLGNDTLNGPRFLRV